MKPTEKLTGLELMQRMVEGIFPMPSICVTIPMNAIKAEKGSFIFEATADDRHLNPMGGVHGGFAATVLDSATGCAVHTTLEAGFNFGTIDLNIKMVRPVPKNITLIAVGTVLNRSRSLAIAEGTLKDAAGKLYAHGTATCMIIRPK